MSTPDPAAPVDETPPNRWQRARLPLLIAGPVVVLALAIYFYMSGGRYEKTDDAYVMAAWGRDQDAIGKLRMLGDGSAELAKKLGLDRDLTKDGMGIRSRRFSLLVEDGVVKQVNVEPPGKFEVSNAETMLAQLGG